MFYSIFRVDIGRVTYSIIRTGGLDRANVTTLNAETGLVRLPFVNPWTGSQWHYLEGGIQIAALLPRCLITLPRTLALYIMPRFAPRGRTR